MVARLVDDHGLMRLQNEARAAEAGAVVCREPPARDGEARGRAERRLAFAVGGPVLDSLLCDPAVLGFLSGLTGVAWGPNGRLGTYSYYRAQGDFLGLHRDARSCDLAVITCLWDTGGPGGDLVVYPSAAGRPLAKVRVDLRQGAHRVPLTPGESVVFLGGMIPHRVTPVGQGRSRAVAPLCYRLAIKD